MRMQEIERYKPCNYNACLHKLSQILSTEAITLKFDQELINLINQTIAIVENAIANADVGKLNGSNYDY